MGQEVDSYHLNATQSGVVVGQLVINEWPLITVSPRIMTFHGTTH